MEKFSLIGEFVGLCFVIIYQNPLPREVILEIQLNAKSSGGIQCFCQPILLQTLYFRPVLFQLTVQV